jgi:hypothetical protein
LLPEVAQVNLEFNDLSEEKNWVLVFEDSFQDPEQLEIKWNPQPVLADSSIIGDIHGNVGLLNRG